MSYCRWSSDNYKCNIYAYESHRGYEIHVASLQIVEDIPPLPDITKVSLEEWSSAYHQQGKALDEATRVPIGLPSDGQSFVLEDLDAFEAWLRALREEGYHFPDYVFEVIANERKEQERNSRMKIKKQATPKAHLKYLWYVLRHKWFVFLWCCRLGIPLAGLTHDLSKFRPSEWFPYVDYFYGGEWPSRHHPHVNYVYGNRYTRDWVRGRFNAAWNHHQKRNPHHWQYWVLLEDSGNIIMLNMPMRYRKEMLADWRGASTAITGKDNTKRWYAENKEKMAIHPEVRLWIEQQLGLVEKDIRMHYGW